MGEVTVEDVRRFYGDAAAALVANGWTVDGAVAHVEGSCDREVCGGVHGDAYAETLIDYAAHARLGIDSPTSREWNLSRVAAFLEAWRLYTGGTSEDADAALAARWSELTAPEEV